MDTTEMFYGDDEESQLSGCISLAYRLIIVRLCLKTVLQFFTAQGSDAEELGLLQGEALGLLLRARRQVRH